MRLKYCVGNTRSARYTTQDFDQFRRSRGSGVTLYRMQAFEWLSKEICMVQATLTDLIMTRHSTGISLYQRPERQCREPCQAECMCTTLIGRQISMTSAAAFSILLGWDAFLAAPSCQPRIQAWDDPASFRVPHSWSQVASTCLPVRKEQGAVSRRSPTGLHNHSSMILACDTR